MANEVRLIDGNALRRKMVDILLRYDTPETFGEKLAVYSAFDEVINSPTIDPESLRPKGRWKYYHKQNIAVCTNCSFERDLEINFGRAISCPNCSAKMEG